MNFRDTWYFWVYNVLYILRIYYILCVTIMGCNENEISRFLARNGGQDTEAQNDLKMWKKHFHGWIRTPDTLIKVGERSPNSLGHRANLWDVLRSLFLIHADRRQFVWSWNILGYRFFELGRVETCHWTWSFLLMFTFIFRWKKLLLYCYFCHTKALKNFRQEFYLLPKWRIEIFLILGNRSRPFLDFFTSFRKSF